MSFLVLTYFLSFLLYIKLVEGLGPNKQMMPNKYPWWLQTCTYCKSKFYIYSIYFGSIPCCDHCQPQHTQYITQQRNHNNFWAVCSTTKAKRWRIATIRPFLLPYSGCKDIEDVILTYLWTIK